MHAVASTTVSRHIAGRRFAIRACVRPQPLFAGWANDLVASMMARTWLHEAECCRLLTTLLQGCTGMQAPNSTCSACSLLGNARKGPGTRSGRHEIQSLLCQWQQLLVRNKQAVCTGSARFGFQVGDLASPFKTQARTRALTGGTSVLPNVRAWMLQAGLTAAARSRLSTKREPFQPRVKALLTATSLAHSTAMTSWLGIMLQSTVSCAAALCTPLLTIPRLLIGSSGHGRCVQRGKRTGGAISSKP